MAALAAAQGRTISSPRYLERTPFEVAAIIVDMRRREDAARTRRREDAIRDAIQIRRHGGD